MISTKMKSSIGNRDTSWEPGRSVVTTRGAVASVVSVTPKPRATMLVSSRTPLASAGPYSSRASSGPMTSRRICPAAASVTMPSSPCPTSMRRCPVPGW